MHSRVKSFCLQVKDLFPDQFRGKSVLDCGSLDINGNNRYLFDGCKYHGIDIVDGPNVDTVTRVHEFLPGQLGVFDTIISTEMLEHDQFYFDTLWHMSDLLKPGGLMLITAAGFGREEHGTADKHPNDSPLTHDHYQNIYPEFLRYLRLKEYEMYEISYLKTDIRFWGKKLPA
jgi:hypothetical protein